MERDALHQWSSVVISGHQSTCGKGCPSSVVISGHQWSSQHLWKGMPFISGHPWSSVVITAPVETSAVAICRHDEGNQRSSRAIAPVEALET